MYTNLTNYFRFIYIYIMYTIIYPLMYIPFAIINRIKNKPSTYSHTITQKCMDYFNCKKDYLTDNNIIDSGFILSNHRCSFDFMFDPYIGKSAVIARYKAILCTFFLSLLGIIERRVIPMQKSFNRNYIFDSTKYLFEYRYPDEDNTFNKRVTFFPEGTRSNYTKIEKLDDTQKILKPGLLKSIYEYNKKPVQIIITKNKEKVYNEFTIDINFGVTLSVYISKEIYPSEFNSYEEFYNHICTQWFNIFNEVYHE